MKNGPFERTVEDESKLRSLMLLFFAVSVIEILQKLATVILIHLRLSVRTVHSSYITPFRCIMGKHWLTRRSCYTQVLGFCKLYIHTKIATEFVEARYHFVVEQGQKLHQESEPYGKGLWVYFENSWIIRDIGNYIFEEIFEEMHVT